VTTAGSDRPSHALSQAEHDEIFRNRIIPGVLATGRSGKLRQPVPPSRKLQVTVFGGRPGSGKSMTKSVVAHLLQPAAAALSGDHPGTMHPRWAGLLRTNDRTAGSAVYYDSRAWFREAIDYCLANRLDFILDTAQDNPERSRLSSAASANPTVPAGRRSISGSSSVHERSRRTAGRRQPRHVADDVAEPGHVPALRRRLDRARHVVDAHGLPPPPHQLGGELAATAGQCASAQPSTADPRQPDGPQPRRATSVPGG
jgi:Zeta toxin